MTRQNLLAGMISSIIFLILFLLLKWHFIVSLVLAAGVFMAVYLLTQPVRKLGNVNLDLLQNGIELQDLYLAALEDLKIMKQGQENLTDPMLKERLDHLCHIADDIMIYLKDHPKEISKSRHFLEYYFDTAGKIISNYNQIQSTHISSQKLQQIQGKTHESVQLLEQIFTKQLEAYHEEKLFALEIETDLLEKTIKLGGDLR